jgi:hypothetical protein
MSATTASLSEVQLLQEEIAHLRAQIAWLKQQLFGPGKSEKLDRAQLLLRLGELEKLAAPARPVETITYERAKGPAESRSLPEENFAHLPVKETVEIVPAAVQAEPELYERIGEERTFEVDVVPPQLFKREIVRPKYRHRLDRNRAPLVAPAPGAAGGWRLRLGRAAGVGGTQQIRRPCPAVSAGADVAALGCHDRTANDGRLGEDHGRVAGADLPAHVSGAAGRWLRPGR